MLIRVDRWDMRLTDKAILNALIKLETPCSQPDIAADLGCGVATVQRSIKRLKDLGVVKPVGSGRRIPFERYEVNHDRLKEVLGDCA